MIFENTEVFLQIYAFHRAKTPNSQDLGPRCIKFEFYAFLGHSLMNMNLKKKGLKDMRDPQLFLEKTRTMNYKLKPAPGR